MNRIVEIDNFFHWKWSTNDWQTNKQSILNNSNNDRWQNITTNGRNEQQQQQKYFLLLCVCWIMQLMIYCDLNLKKKSLNIIGKTFRILNTGKKFLKFFIFESGQISQSAKIYWNWTTCCTLLMILYDWLFWPYFVAISVKSVYNWNIQIIIDR